MRSRMRDALSVVGALVMLTLVSGVVLAASGIPGSDGKFWGCYDRTGTLKVVAEGSSCPKGWTLIYWNQTGPQGLQGLKGDTGATGATGLQGPRGDTPTLSRQVVHVQYYPDPYSVKAYYAMCPPGMVVTGGGFDVDPTKVTVHTSMPWLDGTGTHGWRVYTTNHIGYPTDFGVYAVCVSLN